MRRCTSASIVLVPVVVLVLDWAIEAFARMERDEWRNKWRKVRSGRPRTKDDDDDEDD
jgi:hypothetical protein